jgi:MFS family permease
MTSPGTSAGVTQADGGFPSRGFLALWAATGVSQAGSAVSIVVIPLIAVITLGASPGQMAWLGAVELVPALLIRVPAAAWSDRLRRPRVAVMVACNLVQAVIVGLIPLLWWLGALGFGALLSLAGASSAALGVYSSLSSPLLVKVVPEAHLVDANGKLFATRSAADIAGPAIGSGLLVVLSAPLVVVADAFSFLLSAALLTRVRERSPDRPVTTEAATSHEDRQVTENQEVREGPETHGATRGLALALLRTPAVRVPIIVSLVNGMTQAVLVLFLVRELAMSASLIGLLLAFGAVGGMSGGLLVGRCQKRFGAGRTMAIGAATTVCSLAVLPFSTAGWTGVTGLVALELGSSFGGTLMMATLFGGLQAAAPHDRVARVMALSGVVLQVSALCGVPLGGVIATVFGLRPALFVELGLLLAGVLPYAVRWTASPPAVIVGGLR